MWSLDWFTAERLGRSGAKIRRAAWTDHWLEFHGIWFIMTVSSTEVVETTDIGIVDLNARDWTDQPYGADQCGATPAFNSAPPAYQQWTDTPIFLPPPVPGYA